MYPVLFHVGDFEVTSFGFLVGIAAIVGILVFEREARRSGLAVENTTSAAIAGVIGGLLGAKVVWTIEFSSTAPMLSLLFSRGGMSWFGGLLGGIGTGLWVLRRRRVPIVRALATATPALAIGHAIGRIGCFLVGDDYGRPTTLPWGVAFREGRPPTDVPVHPTQLYETALLLTLAWLLVRWRRAGVRDHEVLGRYFMLAGAIRFSIEFIRVNLRILGPFTLAQLIALGLITWGAVLSLKPTPTASARPGISPRSFRINDRRSRPTRGR
jgi:phosphatidylglycerol---prolipoprotein diacylglyceryl transferase